MADDLMTMPVVPQTSSDSLASSSPPKSISSGLTGQSPPVRKLDTSISKTQDKVSTTVDESGAELSLDDSPEQLEEKLLTKPVTSKVAPKDAIVKPEESKKVESKSDKLSETKDDKESKTVSDKEQVDEGFDLGLDEEVETPKQQQQEGRKARDYSDVSEEQKEVLKHIPNYLYDKAKAYIKQVDTLKRERDELKVEYDKIKSGKLPDHYYEHEQAYLLHPDYAKHTQTQALIDFEEQHYTQQYKAIKSGQAWWELKGYNKNGEPQYVKHESLGENKIDIEAEMYAQRVLNQLANKRNETQQELGRITGDFKQKHEMAKQTFSVINDKFFAKLKDIKKLPEEAQTYYNNALKWLDENIPTYKGHPYHDYLAKAALSNIAKTVQLKKFAEEIKQLKEKKQDVMANGPGSGELSGAGKVAGEKVYDMRDIDEDF